jgi:hypothetical protein
LTSIFTFAKEISRQQLATDGCKKRRGNDLLSADDRMRNGTAELDLYLLDSAFVDFQLVIISGFNDPGEAARPIATGIDAFKVVRSAIISGLEKLVCGIIGIPENRDRNHTGIFQSAGKTLDGIGIVGAGHIFSSALTAAEIDRLNLVNGGEVLGRGAIPNLELATEKSECSCGCVAWHLNLLSF